MPTWAIVLIVVGLGGVMLLGMIAVVAVPALAKYMRRAKTAEAKTQLAKMYDQVAFYYRQNESCPGDEPAGQAGLTPPLSVNCNEGPGGRCVPDAQPTSPGHYSSEAWTQPIWDQIGFLQEQGHYFHYNFIWASDPSTGACQFTVQAFADLDDDGVFSTYERYGAGDVSGVHSAAGLYVDQEVE